jgi:hypothetical protein
MNAPLYLISKRVFKIIACIAFFGALATTAHAQSHDVGRASLLLKGLGWEVLDTIDKGIAYSGEVSGTIPSESKIFINKSAEGDVLAILHVRASKGGITNGYFTYAPTCADKEASFAEGNKGFETSFAQCLLVYPAYTTSSLLAQLSSTERRFIDQYRTKTPTSMRSVFSRYSNQNGSFVQIHILLAPHFLGLLPAATEANSDPYLSWGRALMLQVRGGVNSLSGKVEMPPLAFKSDKLALGLSD